MIAGGAIAGAGGAMVIGSSIAAEVLSSRGAKEADKLINECNVTFANLQEVRKKYQDDLRVHMKVAQMIDKVRIVFEKVKDSIRIIITIGNKITQFIGTIKKEIVCKVFGSGAKNGFKIVDAGKAVNGVVRLTVSTVGRTLDEIGGATFRVAGMSLKIAGIALAGVAIAFDMYTLITTSIDIHKGNLDKAADEIEKIAEDLKNMTPPTTEDTMIESLKSVADELEIPCDVLDIDN
ncbi:uncharacterized protein [Antedon mediterranea]|uniref:uncharacterized protein n=1 Tax=Antedon mediterranea TaxID=105859 RepID=UPI003AF7F2DC